MMRFDVRPFITVYDLDRGSDTAIFVDHIVAITSKENDTMFVFHLDNGDTITTDDFCNLDDALEEFRR